MIPGQANVRGTFLGFLFIGLSHQHLWFTRAENNNKELVIRSGESRAGHQCPKCGAVIIQRFRREWRPPEPRDTL